MTTSHGPAIADLQAQIAALQVQIQTHETALAELRQKQSELQTIVSALEEMEKFMREGAKGLRR
jgi:prefoldin subunit 5